MSARRNDFLFTFKSKNMRYFERNLLLELLRLQNLGKSYLHRSIREFCCDKGGKADLAIIGVGPAGLFGALRAAQNGIKHIVVIDKYPTMGGTCINYGCVPTKCLLKFTHTYHQVKTGFLAIQGVITSEPKLDLDQMMRTKASVMKDLSDYMQNQFKTQGINIIRGKAKLCGCNKISIDGNDGKQSVIEAENILIATGSAVRQFPGVEIDEKQIVSSTGAMNLKEVPKSMFIIGAGIIAVEMGCIWTRLGSKVTIITHDDKIIGTSIDKDIRKKYQKILEGQGLNFVFNTKILKACKGNNCVKFQIADNDGHNKKELECDVLMVAVGRIPSTAGLELERVGIDTNEAGFIPVNCIYQTAAPNIYAAGDVTLGPMTAHKAIEDGILMVDGLCGREVQLDLSYIPMAIYTHPEVACVGKTEEQLEKENRPYRVSWSTFETCARARTDLDTTGCIKALICCKTDRILGTHIIGEHAGEIINEVTLAQQYGLTAEHVARVVHAHPTYAKMLKATFSH